MMMMTLGVMSPVQARPYVVKTDRVFRVNPGATPGYDIDNPLERLLNMIETIEMAAERECYEATTLQYLIPFGHLDLYGPQSPYTDLLDAEFHDFKTDFQKQNIADFVTTDALLVRGYASAGSWTGPFLKLSYNAGPGSQLAQLNNGLLGERIRAFVQINTLQGVMIDVPYNPQTDRYEVEIWGYQGGNLNDQLDTKGRAALASGQIIVRPDLLQGTRGDFARDGKDGQYLGNINPNHGMHPILPLRVQVAWTNQAQTVWDSRNGQNYRYEFNMLLRGWDAYLGTGISPNPHGGIGILEFRNLMSNYFYPQHPNELGRPLQPWALNALGHKDHSVVPGQYEPFMAVNFIDIHVMRPQCGIGIHRHRDNSEIFFMMKGQGLMVMGDWNQQPDRERAFEIRTLTEGHYTMLKPGMLHALMNTTDEDCQLFMFGSYD